MKIENKSGRRIACLFIMLFVCVLICSNICYIVYLYNVSNDKYQNSLIKIDELNKQKNESDIIYNNNILNLQKSIDEKEKLINNLNQNIDLLNQKVLNIQDLNKKPSMNTYNGWELIWEEVNISQSEIDFFAKLLKAESGVMGYEGQFWTASAILNLSKRSNSSISNLGHDINTFAVAPFVDNVKPDDMQYQIIYNILNNGWIKDVCYFRTEYPHNFGRFMKQIENVYFNAPN